MKRHSNVNGSGDLSCKRESTRKNREGKKVIRFRAKDTPGVIYIERSIHDEAVVISGSLILENDSADLNEWIGEEIAAAAREIRAQGGVVGQIEAALTVTSTKITALSDEKPVEKESPRKDVRIVLAAIIYKIEPKVAEDIVRKALAGVRAKNK